jgi:spore maturation protein SpmA/SAM-dependent methyltransferase
VNAVFYWIVALAVMAAAWTGTPAEVGKAALDSSKAAVELAIGLVGYIALFLGLMKVVEEAGGLKFMARIIRPVLVRLFPDIPPDHPAMGAMVMNIAANALGLGNAATPFGLKAMTELNKLNKEEGTATNAMILFLAINTSGLALLPTGMIGLRNHFGSADPAAIFPTTLAATALSTLVGVSVAKWLSRRRMFAPPEVQAEADAAIAAARPKEGLADLLPLLAFGALLLGMVGLVYVYEEKASAWILPALIIGMLTVGYVRKVKVYETFVTGAKEGFSLAIMIIPYLVAILAAVGMFKKSGAMAWLVGFLEPVTSLIGMPGEVLPLALMRPLSGSGAFGITSSLVETHGADSLIGTLATTMNGSTDTTFYVLAVYFGSVGVSRIRHAVPAGLAADLTGALAAVAAVHLLLPGLPLSIPQDGEAAPVEAAAPPEPHEAAAEAEHDEAKHAGGDHATVSHRFDDVDRWAGVFDDPARDEWQKPAELVAALGVQSGAVVADIGAGTGYFNPHLAGAVGPDGRVIAVDIEPNLVLHMAARAKKDGTPQVEARLGLPGDPMLATGEVDLILIVDTYHHISDRVEYFTALRGTLRTPGARLVIVDFIKDAEIPVGPPPGARIAASQVTEELGAAGWEPVQAHDALLPYQYTRVFITARGR